MWRGRKLRVAKPGKGKSGGYRAITFFADQRFPAFLLTVFGKSEKANLAKAGRNALAMLAKRLTDALTRRTIAHPAEKGS